MSPKPHSEVSISLKDISLKIIRFRIVGSLPSLEIEKNTKLYKQVCLSLSYILLLVKECGI